MDDENERREYVLSQDGLIFQGTSDYIYSIPWNFGQVSRQGPLGPLGPLAMQLWCCRTQGLVPRVCPSPACAPNAVSTSESSHGSKNPESHFQQGMC